MPRQCPSALPAGPQAAQHHTHSHFVIWSVCFRCLQEILLLNSRLADVSGQVRVQQGECEQLQHRHACTVRYYNSTLHSIEAQAAQQAAQVGSM